MKAVFWNIVASICCRPFVAEWLIRRSKSTPFKHLGGYMLRWWLMPRWMLTHDDEGYLEPKRWLPFGIRIHHILREDADPYLHSHPFAWRTIILKGFYVEEDVWGNRHVRLPGDTRLATPETLHRIDSVCERGVWTLFIVGRKKSPWGFMLGNPPRMIHHKDYHSPNKRTHADLLEKAS